jgi:hypothetical protein
MPCQSVTGHGIVARLRNGIVIYCVLATAALVTPWYVKRDIPVRGVACIVYCVF